MNIWFTDNVVLMHIHVHICTHPHIQSVGLYMYTHKLINLRFMLQIHLLVGKHIQIHKDPQQRYNYYVVIVISPQED
jgi:hypothetical protein